MEGNAMMTKEQTTIINSLRSQGFGYKQYDKIISQKN